MSGISLTQNNHPPTQVISDLSDITLAPTIKGVLLDLDNCLYRYDDCHLRAINAAKEALEENLGLMPDFFKRYEEAKLMVKSKLSTQAASHSRLLYFQALLESLHPVSAPIENALWMEEAYWRTFMAEMRPIPGLYEFLATCRQKRIKTIVVSDMTAQIQFKKMAVLKIADKIDFVVTSEEAGVEKPSPQIFELGLKKAQLSPAQVIIIGDDPARDGQGAHSLGTPWVQITHT